MQREERRGEGGKEEADDEMNYSTSMAFTEDLTAKITDVCH